MAITQNTPLDGQTLTHLRYFSYDGEGGILTRRDGTLNNGAFTETVDSRKHFTYVNGQQVATLGEDGKIDAASQLTAFDSSSLGTEPALVLEGDTLQSIAQRVYGNGSLWYVLAAANAVTDADLVAGTTLRAPQVTTTANDASTFKPYDPNSILGPTTPSLPYIAPPPKQQCNAVAQILMVVVAIIVTVYTAGALTSAMVGAVPGATAAGGAMAVGGAALTGGVVGATAGASLTLSTVGSMLVGAAAGAAGAAASMAVGSVMGVASFSWRGVAAQGLAAGLTAGFGAAARAGTFGRTLQTSNYARAAAGAVAGNLANYSANRLVGNEAHFSWASVAASAVSAVLTAKVVPTLADKLEINRLTENGQTQLDLLGGMVGGVVSASVRKAFVGGDVDYGQVALDAFGNMLGNRLSGQHGNWASQTQLDMGSIARVGVGISFAGGPHYPEMRSFGGPSPSFDDDVPYSMGGPITDIDRVTVFGTRDNPTSGGAWMWNSQADKWLNMDTGRLYAPSARQQVVVQGWSPVPKVVSSNGGGYSLVDFFGGQENFAKATASTWGIDRVTRDLQAPNAYQVDDYQRNGRITQTMGPMAPSSRRESILQSMRDSRIGQSPAGRAYLGAVDFTTAIPGQVGDAVVGAAQLMTYSGRMEVSMALAGAVRERGLLGAGAHAMASTVDGIQQWYRQAYFGDEEDAARALLQAGSLFAPARFGGVANTRAPLTYDISKWGEYGLPSDGYFVRTLTPKQYRDFQAGLDFEFGGKAVEGYPDGMGFIASAEEARSLTTVSGYREALKLDYDPKFVMEFQLRDPAGLQNVLYAPYPEFVVGGRSGAGFLEWNYPGISSSQIVNPYVRILK